MSTTFDIDSTIVDVSVVVPYEVTATASVVLPVVYEAQESVPPTIDNVEILEVGTNSIEISFDVDKRGATECVNGVLWGTTNPPTFSGGDYRLQYGEGNIDLDIAGLLNSTTYYLRPYALSNLGYTYGDVVEQTTSESPIPDEYQLVEYLQSDGNAYINTGYYVSSRDTEQFVEFKGLESGECVMGANNPWTPAYYSPSFGYIYIAIGSSDNTAQRLLPNHSISLLITSGNSFEWTLNGERISGIYGGTIVNNNMPICLFRNGTNLNPSRCSIFRCYIKEENILKRDLYPVYRKSDSVAGMYDIVNGVFYTNQGSGTFVVGADKDWEEEE